MTGRVLVQPFPGYGPSFPQGGSAVPSPQPPFPAAQAWPPAQAAAPRPTAVRGQIPDDPAPQLRAQPAVQRPREVVTIPPPEELGVTCTKPAEAGIDWGAVNRRLDKLGAVCFQLDRQPQGRWRVVCLLPTAQAEHSHRIEAEADVKADAVRLTLEQAEQWAQKR